MIAALFSGAQIELAAGVIWITFEAMVAGVTVATTADVAPSASVTVKVTGAGSKHILGHDDERRTGDGGRHRHQRVVA
ncbi:MAG: hypothetical protein U1F05_06960 [Burkholderiales bacterium]